MIFVLFEMPTLDSYSYIEPYWYEQDVYLIPDPIFSDVEPYITAGISDMLASDCDLIQTSPGEFLSFERSIKNISTQAAWAVYMIKIERQ